MDRVDAETLTDGTIHPVSCAEQGCVDGVVLRGAFTDFSVPEDDCSFASAYWNAMAIEVKAAIEECSNNTRAVSASIPTACNFYISPDLLTEGVHYPALVSYTGLEI